MNTKELITKYPWLKFKDCEDDSIKEDEFCWFDEIPDGWAAAFGEEMCEEIHQELVKYNYIDKFEILQIKEKFGELRFYAGCVPKGSKIWEIIDKYTIMSRAICINCGKPAKWISTGWISPYCDECARVSPNFEKEFEAIYYE